MLKVGYSRRSRQRQSGKEGRTVARQVLWSLLDWSEPLELECKMVRVMKGWINMLIAHFGDFSGTEDRNQEEAWAVEWVGSR